MSTPQTLSAPPVLTVTAPDLRAPFRYLVVEGPISVGKTSLAGLFAERWSLRPVLEQAGVNPFLERFYRDSARHALATQLHFLLRRAERASAVAALEPDTESIVTDFLPQKDELFASVTLDDDELQLYRALAARVAAPRRLPDLVIYLQASPEVLFARIQKRAIAMELQISDAYLRALCDAYNNFFYHYDDAPLLTVNAEHLDPLGNEADLTLLIEHIESMRGRKAFFSKGTQL